MRAGWKDVSGMCCECSEDWKLDACCGGGSCETPENCCGRISHAAGAGVCCPCISCTGRSGTKKLCCGGHAWPPAGVAGGTGAGAAQSCGGGSARRGSPDGLYKLYKLRLPREPSSLAKISAKQQRMEKEQGSSPGLKYCDPRTGDGLGRSQN